MRTILFILVLLPLISLCQDANDPQQEMSFEEYNPTSTLVVPENPVTRAKFPFVDIHSHQWNLTKEGIANLVEEMEDLNMGAMINLSGF